jgi:dCTP deaminase
MRTLARQEGAGVILSDRDIREQLDSGRVVIDPLDEHAVQPSSVDLRVGDTFRVFANHRRSYIDVRDPMDDLTEDVTATEAEPFILHPGEFVLGSTLETIALPDDIVGRVEGKSSLGRLGLLIHSSLPASEELLLRVGDEVVRITIGEMVKGQIEGAVVGFDPDTFEVGYHDVTGWYEGPADRIFEVRLRSGRRVQVTAGHNLFTLNRDGELVKTPTQGLQPGSRVAVPARIPEPGGEAPILDMLALLPEADARQVSVEGPTVARLFAERRPEVATALAEVGIGNARYYVRNARLPWSVGRQFLAPDDLHGDRVRFRQSRQTLPTRLPVNADVAWLLGLYVAEGYTRRGQVVWSNTDETILDRVAGVLADLGVPAYRSEGRNVTAMSSLLASVVSWIGCSGHAVDKRVPTAVFGWPDELLAAFLDGFVDGDGSREVTRDSLWTSSPGLVSDLLLILTRLGRRAAAYARRRPGVAPAYQVAAPHREHKLRPVEGDLVWDEVLEVVDTGRVEPVYDLEVRPGGQRVENFLAGQGGVFVSNTAGFVDAGFRGHLTLELSNVANLPIAIYPGMRIGQLCFFRTTSPAERPYGSPELRSKYQGQQGPTPSRYFENFDE